MMRVDDFALYGARLQDMECGAVKISNEYYFGKQSFYPHLLNSERSTRRLSLTLEFSDTDWHKTVANISKFTTAVSGRADIYLPDGFGYFCVFVGASEPEVVLPNKQYVTFEFDAVRHGEAVSIKLVNSTIQCESGVSVPCRIEIVPHISVASITVAGITIKNVSVNQKIVIDGISKQVLQEGKNKFMDTDLIEFPVLYPGENSFDIPDNLSISMTYYPVYL